MEKQNTDAAPKSNRYLEALRPAGRFTAALTIFYAWTQLTSQPLTQLLAVPFRLYRGYVEWLAKWIEPYVEKFVHFLGSLIHLDVQFNSNWKFLAVPLFFYFSRDAVELLDRKRWATALGGGLIALLILLLCSIQVADALWVQLGLPTAGLAVYALGQSYLTARFHPPGNQGFAETFWYYFRNTFFPTAFMAFAAFWLSLLAARLFPGSFGPVQAIAGAMLLYVFLMGLYWLAQAREVAKRDGHNVRDLGAYKLGAGILWTMRSVAILLISNWLANLAGFPAG